MIHYPTRCRSHVVRK